MEVSPIAHRQTSSTGWWLLQPQRGSDTIYHSKIQLPGIEPSLKMQRARRTPYRLAIRLKCCAISRTSKPYKPMTRAHKFLCIVFTAVPISIHAVIVERLKAGSSCDLQEQQTVETKWTWGKSVSLTCDTKSCIAKLELHEVCAWQKTMLVGLTAQKGVKN